MKKSNSQNLIYPEEYKAQMIERILRLSGILTQGTKPNPTSACDRLNIKDTNNYTKTE